MLDAARAELRWSSARMTRAVAGRSSVGARRPTARAPAHREGPDLDLIVEWAAGRETALDVATGGGHVARRLREAGLDVVTADPAPGMKPDVDLPAARICRSPTGSFDLVVCRIARAPLRRRRARRCARWRGSRADAVVDRRQHLRRRGARGGRALRDPSHVRCYPEEEWRALFEEAGLDVEDVRFMRSASSSSRGSTAPAARARTAPRVRELARRPDRGRLGHARPDRPEGRGSNGDHRRQGDEARRPGPDRAARARSTACATAPTARRSSPA